MSDVAETVAFGLFRLDTRRRILLADGTPVALHARAFDLLEFLVANRDRVVGRDEVVAHVWRGIAVGENNLNVQLSALRRTLVDHGADGLIVTLPGRGYRFVGDVSAATPAVPDAPAHQPAQAVGTASSKLGEPLDWESVHRPTSLSVALAARRRSILMGAAMLGAGALGAAFLPHMEGNKTVLPPRLSIAVLSFRNLGDDTKLADLADAISDDLTTDLSHLPGSLVIARTSSDTYKGKEVSADRIGHALNVRYVLEGSVRAVQGTVRVNAQLIDASSNTHLWAEHFDAGTDRLWDAQNDIVRGIDRAIGMALMHEDVAEAARDRPGRPDALDLFFHARSVLDGGTGPVQLIEAKQLLEKAVDAEPDFVEALATLGWVLVNHALNYDYDGFMDDAEEADRVTARARKLEPMNADVLAARGRFLTYRGAMTDAAASFQLALDKDPNNIWALTGMAVCEWRIGKPDSVIGPEEKLVLLDPKSPATSGHYQTLGLAALFSGHFEKAIQSLLRADVEDSSPLEPDTMAPTETTRVFLIAAYQMAGDTVEARKRYEAFSATWKHRSVWREMAFFTASQQRLAQFDRIADALEAAGMPRYADAQEDDHVAPTVSPLTEGDFTPTPTSIPLADGSIIDVARLDQLLSKPPAPIVVDVGRRCVLIQGSVFLSDKDAAGDRPSLEHSAFGERIRAAPDAPIVVMGTGSSGSNSYNVTLHLLTLFHRSMFWFRGGEEAWAAHAGMRTPNHCEG